MNGLLNTLKTEVAHGDLIAKSVGSDNLTSDYDITVASKDGPGLEIEVVREFNKRVQAKFGGPPGVAFDTNLYVKDFLSLTGNIPGVEGEDAAIAPVDVTFGTTNDSDQDVGSLIEQRQYMPADEWKAYVDGVKKGLASNPAKLREATLQFEESDALYLLNMREKAERFLKKLKAASPPLPRSPKLQELETWFDGLSGKKYDQALENEMQRKLDELSEVSQHDAPDIALAANNEIYLEKMEAVRKLQSRHRVLDQIAAKVKTVANRDLKLKAIQATLEKLYPAPKEGDKDAVLAAQRRKDVFDNFALYQGDPSLDVDFWLDDKIMGLKAQAKKQVA